MWMMKVIGGLALIFLGSLLGVLTDARQAEPQSAYIAFTSNRDGQRDIYRMRVDGSQVERLTNTSALEFDMAWSPDGQHIVFTEAVLQRRFAYQLRLLNVHSRHIEQLTPLIGEYDAPHWSSDGSHLIFSTRYDNDHRNIYRLTLGETEPIRLTNWPASDFHPIYAPDGRSIIFSSNYQSIKLNLYRMSVDGADIIQLTDASDSISQPTWSPDGETIVYIRFREAKSELYRLVLDGTEAEPIVVSDTYVLNPIWSPDGKWILFDSNPTGNFEIYRIRPDGSQRENLTATLGDDEMPIWSPLIDKSWHPRQLLLYSFLLIGLGSSIIYLVKKQILGGMT